MFTPFKSMTADDTGCRGSSTYTCYKDAEINITVHPEYIPHIKIHGGAEFCFAYHIIITNRGAIPVQLIARRWVTTDGDSNVRHIEGTGVTGEQPRIKGGDSYEYTSYVDFKTPTGSMHGAYLMQTDDGDQFETTIETFSMTAPHAIN